MPYPIHKFAACVCNNAKKDAPLYGKLLRAAFADYYAEPTELHYANVREWLQTIIDNEPDGKLWRPYTLTVASTALAKLNEIHTR